MDFSRLVPDLEGPFGGVESLLYDSLIAPAVMHLARALRGEIFGDVPVGARVLDVGCGGGQIARWVARQQPGVRVTGLDLSPAQIDKARRRAKRSKASRRPEFVVGSALELPFADDSFDVVLSVASIKHWPEPARGLSECVRVLRPGGRLLVVEADRGCTLDSARRFVDLWRVPRVLVPIALAFFRTHVAGLSFDLEELTTLAAELSLRERAVRRLEGLPAILLSGRV